MTLSDLTNIINALGATTLLIFGWLQLMDLKKTKKAELLAAHRRDLFTQETITLITIIHSDCLVFDRNGNHPFFSINTNQLKRLYPERNWRHRIYTTYEIDCMLLNHLDEIGSLHKNGIINFETARQYFGWYILVVCSNNAIDEYFKWLASYENSSYVFMNLYNLHDKLIAFTDK